MSVRRPAGRRRQEAGQPLRGRLASRGGTRARAGMSFTGDLGELALCDLVEITTVGGKTGVLELVRRRRRARRRLAFRDGRLVGARLRRSSSARRPSTRCSASKRAASSSTPSSSPARPSVDLPTELAAHGSHAPRRRERPTARRACRRRPSSRSLGGRARRRRRGHGPRLPRARAQRTVGRHRRRERSSPATRRRVRRRCGPCAACATAASCAGRPTRRRHGERDLSAEGPSQREA